jgi:regulator of sigma E protease
MTILIKTLQFFLSLSILVVIHELGHFGFAKLFKTRVDKLYLFFDPWFSLFKIKKGDTEYGIGWLPLGGYAKISGMIDESMDTEQLKKPPQPYEFRSKTTWQRLLIITGGVIMNFLLGFIIYSTILYVWGEEYLPTENVKYGIVADSLAVNIGLRNGDKIISVDNKKVESFHDFVVKTILLNQSKSIQIQRDSQMMSIEIPKQTISYILQHKNEMATFITPRVPFIVKDGNKTMLLKDDKVVGINNEKLVYYDEIKSMLLKYKGKKIQLNIQREGKEMVIPVKLSKEGLIGVEMYGYNNYFDIKTIHYGFFACIPAGIKKGFSSISDYLKQFKLIFSREHKGYEQLGGFIAMGNIFPGTWDWEFFWRWTAFLSIILAIMNILPIPALDGGFMLFILFEMITGKKPGDKFLEYAQIVGMVIVFSLILYANGNDIIRLFHK